MRLFSSCGRKLRVPLHLRWGPQGTSHDGSGKSRLLSSCEGECGIALESLERNLASSPIDKGIRWCFSSCGGILRVSLDL